jgi:hypothetical protein
MREIRHTLHDPNHFTFPRQSHIPHGYFGRNDWHWLPRFLRAVLAWACFAGVALGLAVFAMGVAQ